MLIILVYCGGYADDKHRVVVVNAAAYADDFTDPLNGSRTEYDQELQLNETSTYSGFPSDTFHRLSHEVRHEKLCTAPKKAQQKAGEGSKPCDFDMGQNFGFWAARSSGRRVGCRRAYDDSVSVSWSAPCFSCSNAARAKVQTPS